MRRTVGLILAYLLWLFPLWAGAAQARGELNAEPRYRVLRVQASPDTAENQTTLLLKVSQASGGQPTFWAAERRIEWRKWRDRGVIHQWIDGRDCPALGLALAGIGKLPAMKIAAPDAPPTAFPFHWAITTLSGPAAGGAEGSISVARTDFKGGVSEWWSRSEKILQPCWKNGPVSDGAGPLRAFLNSKEDADNWRP